MVTRILLILFTGNCFLCCTPLIHQQGIEQINEFEITVKADNDSIEFGDSLSLTLYFKNVSDEVIRISTKGRIVIEHNYLGFINPDSNQLPGIVLNRLNKDDLGVILKPDSSVVDVYSIEVCDDFFYSGKNYIYIYYLYKNGSRLDRHEIIEGFCLSSEIEFFVNAE